jgi:3-oxoacyl-[acyl-carrier-protein] synthase-3
VFAKIDRITYHLPERVLTNEEIASKQSKWTPEDILKKTGIHERRIASESECSSDLAFYAAQKLFDLSPSDRSRVDYVLFCTQTPDNVLPTTACVLQKRLGLSQKCGALDFNLGCSGYVYGLGLAKGLIETRQASCVLLLTGETYSKIINPEDFSTRTIFGDAGSATLVVAGIECNSEAIGPFEFGTDGGGMDALCVEGSGFRNSIQTDCLPQKPKLVMKGSDVFSFTLRVVPPLMKELMKKSGRTIDTVDMVVPHQANIFMLDHLQKKLEVPDSKFFKCLTMTGNTVSNSIPIALSLAEQSQKLKDNSTVALLGFGVGLSWAGCMITWKPKS